MILETVKVVSQEAEQGFIVINKTDFDMDIHELLGSEPEAPEDPKPPLTKPKK